MARGRLIRYPQRQPQARPRGRGRAPVASRGPGLHGRSPLPFDSTAQREASVLGNEAADTRANLAAKLSRSEFDLGFGQGADNPYGDTTLNRDQLAQGLRASVNGSGRQLYAGSTLNKQSAARGQYDRNQKEIEDSIAEAQAGYNEGRARTQRDTALGLAGIKEGAIERRLATEPKPLAVPARGRRRAPARRGRALPGVPRQPIRLTPQQAQKINARINGRGRV